MQKGVLGRGVLFTAFVLSFGNMLRAQPTVSLSSGPATQGGTVTLTLSISGTSANPPASLQWTLTYSTSAVSKISATAGAALSSAGKTLTCAGSAGAYTCVAAGINSTTIADGALASISVTLAGSSGASIGLSGVLGASPAGTTISIPATGGAVGVPPQPVSVSPSSGTGTSQTFGFLFADSNGAADMTAVQMVFNSSMSGINGCYVNVDPIHKLLSLANDASTSWLTSLTAGGIGSSQNSHCILNATGSSVTSSGNNLTVNLALTFTPAFGGAQGIWAYAQNAAGVASGWMQLGTWTVPLPPTVHIDSPTPGSPVNGVITLAGWAIDNASYAGAAIGGVQVLVDGASVGYATYGVSRPDVCTVYPGRPSCPNVGFSYQLNTAGLSPGQHTITVSATDTDTTPDTGTSSVTVSIGAVPPTVHIDNPLSGSLLTGTVTVSGWAIDNASSIGTKIGRVQVLVDGTAVGNATYGVSRPDVCAFYAGRPGCPNVGFTYQLNLSTLSAGSHTVTVSATDTDSTPDTGTASMTITTSSTVTASPSVHIDMPANGTTVSGTVTVAGWAIDNTSYAGTAISTVQVLVDGVRVDNAAYGVSRPDVCTVYPGRTGCPNVGFTFALNTATLSSGSHTLTVTATDGDSTPDTGTTSIKIVR